MSPDETSPTGVNRDRILRAAEELLAQGGPEAVGTRAVSGAAGVQAPTIYRIFGDKQGLLDAVASAGFQRYLTGPQAPEPTEDPLEDLRAGWDQHIGFALANPYLYALVYGEPSRHENSPTTAAAARVVAAKVHRLAERGLLSMSEERATQLLLAAGSGTALTLIGTPMEQRDLSLSHTVREACIAALTVPAPAVPTGNLVGAAVALRADLQEMPEFSSGEKALLAEWLDRIINRKAPGA
ncbi:TetR/AcrR family transcriptional regulator [Actinoplanes sp. M2I2]|uniref:TetR/AcrR family transcriptional regulator n=1 Tax=Actinoplanes sp. M2I2 TaxID=1734444 RepID=UPI002021B317|nr:TetR/AcrR family transcriptional regulator [Actinoplanes sp. M2I2]